MTKSAAQLKQDHLDKRDVAIDNLLIEVHFGFDGSILDEIADKYDITINDMSNDINIDDLVFPIEDKNDLLNQILNLKKIEE